MNNDQAHKLHLRLEITNMQQAFDYIATKFRAARERIDHAAFSPEIMGFAQYAGPYTRAIADLVAENKVLYRYVAGVDVDIERRGHRLHGIRRHLEAADARGDDELNYVARVIFTDTQFNGVNYFVFDRKELGIYIPGADGEPGLGLFTGDPSEVSAYLSNFTGLWQQARRVDSVAEVQRIHQQLEKLRPISAPQVRAISEPSVHPEVSNVLSICRRLREVANVLAHRSRPGKLSFEVSDEYDVQDLLHAALRMYTSQVITENPISKVMGTISGRADFTIEHLGVLIEVKYARQASDQGRILKEISSDLVLYTKWAPLSTLIFLIYGSNNLVNHGAFQDIEGPQVVANTAFQIVVVLV